MTKEKFTEEEQDYSPLPDPIEFGSRLVEVRTALGKTAKQIAEEIGVSNSRLSSNMTGQKMLGVDLVWWLWKVYDVSPYYMVTGFGPMFMSFDQVETSQADVMQNLGRSLDDLYRYVLQFGPIGQPRTNIKSVTRTTDHRYSADDIIHLLNQLKKESGENA